MSNLTITSKHPIRAAVSELPDYYDSLSAAACAVRAALADHQLRMDDPDFVGDEGYVTCVVRADPDALFVCSCCGDKLDRSRFDNVVVLSYYKCREGRWEVIKYVS